MKSIFFFFSLLLLSSYALAAEPPVRSEMDRVFQAFRELQPLIFRKDDFLKVENEERIKELLKTLGHSFRHVENISTQGEIGFRTTLEVLQELLDDSSKRFNEGKKEYSLWRLRTATSYCISCHARGTSKREFVDEEGVPGLSPAELAEFLLATRQFEKSKAQFAAIAVAAETPGGRLEALRRWLLIVTRVEQRPAESLKELLSLREKAQLNALQEEEVKNWIVSFRRWVNEGATPTELSRLRRAEHLLSQARVLNSESPGQRSPGEGGWRLAGQGTVELLRASGLLHQVLEESELKTEDRGYALYLLGLCYRELPFFFAPELPEVLLEKSIRVAPGTISAQRAYKVLYDIVTVSFTGSGGTHIPSDVKLKLSDLYKLAFSEIKISGAI